MARVRWADLGPDEVVPLPAEAWQQPAAEQEDAWGPEDESHAAEDAALLEQQPARAVSAAQQTALAALLSAAHRQPLQPEPLQNRLPKHLRPEVPTPLSSRQQQQPQQQQVRMYQVPSLHQLCCTVLAQHVTAVVEQLQEQVQWLPTDVRAALLAVARWGKVSPVLPGGSRVPVSTAVCYCVAGNAMPLTALQWQRSTLVLMHLYSRFALPPLGC